MRGKRRLFTEGYGEMKFKAVSGIMLTLLLVSMLTLAFNIQPNEAEPTTIIVPDDYEKIQWAIGNASDGDTIFVWAGTYYEHVFVNRTVSLTGDYRVALLGATIIDGGGIITPVVHITANNVTIRGFTIQNSGRIYGLEGGGIYIADSNTNNIVNNTVTNTQYGINLSNSTSNTIFGNTMIENDVGIQFLEDYSGNSTIYHNSFINNGWQFSDLAASNNTWDNGYPSGGNYWSDHNPPDIYSGPHQNETGRDKIGDIPYVIDENNTDRYPLIYPYGYDLYDPLAADMNYDGTVDIFDALILAGTFGSEPGHPRWRPAADLNQDGIIDIFDALIFSWLIWRPIIL